MYMMEVDRVLRPGGYCIFTIPVFDRTQTIERAALEEGELIHMLPATYHNDQLRGEVLVFRDYGHDWIERVREAGFEIEGVISADNMSGLAFDRPGFDRPVIIAVKPFLRAGVE